MNEVVRSADRLPKGSSREELRPVRRWWGPVYVAMLTGVLVASVWLSPSSSFATNGGYLQIFEWLLPALTAAAWLRGAYLCWAGKLRQQPTQLLQFGLLASVLFYLGLFFSPYGLNEEHSLACIGLAAFAGTAAFANSAFRIINARFLFFTTVITVNVAITIIGLELGLRLLSGMNPSLPWLAQPGSSPAENVERYRFPLSNDVWSLHVNSSGENDVEFVPKQEGECLIASISDSYSQSVGGLERHFTSVAERNLPGCQIYNFGVSCIGPREYLYLLKTEVLRVNPDLIVVNLFMGNDFTDIVDLDKPEHQATRRRLLLYSVLRRFWLTAREKWRVRLEPSIATDTSPENGVPGSEIPPWIRDPLLEHPTFSEETFIDIERNRAAIMTSTELDSFVTEMLAVLQEIRAAAGNIPVRFVLIPDEFQVEDTLWAEIEQRADASLGKLERDRPQRILRDWFDQNHIAYLDLLPDLRAAEPLRDGRKHVYYSRDTHFNPRGHEIAGRALARFTRKGPSTGASPVAVSEILDSHSSSHEVGLY